VTDFLSTEIIPGGHVSAKMSLGGETAVATATSSIIKVNDGQWHEVVIKVRSKVVFVPYRLNVTQLAKSRLIFRF